MKKNTLRKSQTGGALKRMIISLLCQNALTVSKMDQIFALGLHRGYGKSYIEDLMVECYAEVGVS